MSGIDSFNLAFQTYHKSTYTGFLLNFTSFTLYSYKVSSFKEKPAHWNLSRWSFYVSIVVCQINLKWVSLRIFAWTQSNLNFSIHRKLGCNDFYLLAISKLFQYTQRLDWSKYVSYVSLLLVFASKGSLSFLVIASQLRFQIEGVCS